MSAAKHPRLRAKAATDNTARKIASVHSLAVEREKRRRVSSDGKDGEDAGKGEQRPEGTLLRFPRLGQRLYRRYFGPEEVPRNPRGSFWVRIDAEDPDRRPSASDPEEAD